MQVVTAVKQGMPLGERIQQCLDSLDGQIRNGKVADPDQLGRTFELSQTLTDELIEGREHIKSLWGF